jgi:hypothetical protein
MAKRGLTQEPDDADAIERLLDVFWSSQSEELRKVAYVSLLSYRFLHMVASDDFAFLADEIDSIEDTEPELENALRDAGSDFYLGRLVSPRISPCIMLGYGIS